VLKLQKINKSMGLFPGTPKIVLRYVLLYCFFCHRCSCNLFVGLYVEHNCDVQLCLEAQFHSMNILQLVVFVCMGWWEWFMWFLSRVCVEILY